jgi:hypothetical protein
MMLQNVIVFLIIAAAVAYLARLTWLSMIGKKGCGCGSGGGCSKAGGMSRPPANGLVQISLNGKSASTGGSPRSSSFSAKPPGPSSDR